MIDFAIDAAAGLMGALRDAIDAGGAAGYVELYGNARPAGGGSPEPDSLIAVLPLAYPCGSVDAGGLLQISNSGAAVITAALTPTWARFRTSADAWVIDVNARLTGTTPDPDDPEELIVDAPELEVDKFARVAGGYFYL